MGSICQDDEYEEISLSVTTQAFLNEFLLEKQAKLTSQDEEEMVTEDWQLSQFWYSSETSERIVEESIAALRGKGGNICCLSCPSLIPFFLKREELKRDLDRVNVFLFEYDTRFQTKYGDIFIPYDYAFPHNFPKTLRTFFDVIVADPPFLSEECFVKVAQTIKLLSRDNSSAIIISTGTIMEELLHRLLNLRVTCFKPVHAKNLANDFSTFTNYTPITL